MSKEILKINRNGDIIAKFVSAQDAADDASTNKYAITNRAKGRIKSPYNGFYYKYSGRVTEQINFKFNINDEINDEKGHILIIDRYYKNGIGKIYRYKCLKCGYVGEISSYKLEKKKIRCSACCKNSKIKDYKYLNSISKTHSWVIEYLYDKSDAEKYTYGSGKKIKTICPVCNNISYKTISKLITNGFYCEKCGIGVSYPNKLIERILFINNIIFEKEKKFEWSENKRYDFFIPSLNYIIEVDGIQHYKGFGKLKTFEEINENDVRKEILAKKNGINGYFHVNASISNCEFIINEIKKIKELSFLNLNFSFNELNKYIMNNSSIYDDIVDLWENGMTTTEIGKIYGLNKATISKYLKNATLLGKINYNPQNDKNRNKKKKVKDLQTNKIYSSILECSKILCISRNTIINNKKRFKIWK